METGTQQLLKPTETKQQIDWDVSAANNAFFRVAYRVQS